MNVLMTHTTVIISATTPRAPTSAAAIVATG